jgi:hypothetical protein
MLSVLSSEIRDETSNVDCIRETACTHQRDDSLAVGMSLEVVLTLQPLFQLQVVVDLSIDGEDDLSVVAHKRLCARV